MSYRRLRRSLQAVALCLGAGASLTATAAPWRIDARVAAPTDRIIVKWRDTGVAAMQIARSEDRATRLSQASGIPLRSIREIRERLDVMRLASPLGSKELRRVIARLSADPSVQYAEADERRYALAFPIDAPPNDLRFTAGSDTYGEWQGQWYLHDPSATAPAAIGASSAWKTATGAPYVIAIIDTGVDFTHPDLGRYGDGKGGKLLPGRDFICNDLGSNCSDPGANDTYLVANDGGGWDADATDPGDWIDAADLARSDNFFKDCGDGSNHDQPFNSTWHGTRVAGIAAALTNNAIGTAGVAPDSYLLPVRVIGKCSGYVSDIVAGMYWAAGLSAATLNGVSANLHPAQVLNLSIGGRAPCSLTEQDAVTAIVQDGHVVVVAAGNDGGPVSAPANCQGALAVAGIRHIGTKVGYSNVSSSAAAITIAAPAGNCVNLNLQHPWSLPCLYSIETTSNDGVTVPGQPFYTYAQMVPGYAGNILNEGTIGTSFAAPIVSGVVALMVQANPNLNVNRIVARLQAAATAFPVPATPPTGGVCHVATLAKDASGHYSDIQNDECQCTTATCGAGMLNAVAAVAQALYPIASIATSTDKASLGQTVTLDGRDSAASSNHAIAAYQWTSNPSVAISNSNTSLAKLKFPALRPITVTLTVTDDAGRQDTGTKTINSTALSAGGGGGALGFAGLLMLVLAAGAVILRRRGTSIAMLRGRLTHLEPPSTFEER